MPVTLPVSITCINTMMPPTKIFVCFAQVKDATTDLALVWNVVEVLKQILIS